MFLVLASQGVDMKWNICATCYRLSLESVDTSNFDLQVVAVFGV